MVAPEGKPTPPPVQLGGAQVPPVTQAGEVGGAVNMLQPVQALATVLPAGQGP